MNELKHVAIIMDGNGRWAKKQNRERTYGHYQGVENVRNIAIKANDLHVQVVTLYAFSTENWTRPLEEVSYLMKLPALFFQRFMKELMEKNIRITMIGEWDRIPADTQTVFRKAIADTANNTGMILNFAMNYGGKRELTLAAVRYANDVKNGKIGLDITEEQFRDYLLASAYPDVDLLIRTSGEQRISNFLLWEIAYAELAFVPEAWPEFTPQRFEEVLNEYQNRSRRYGGIQ